MNFPVFRFQNFHKKQNILSKKTTTNIITTGRTVQCFSSNVEKYIQERKLSILKNISLNCDRSSTIQKTPSKMGIFCQVNLFKPPDGAFYCGEIVSGMIKYAFDEPMDVEKITISLKGMGQLNITEKNRRKGTKRSYSNSEVYVDNDKVIQEGKFKVPVGSYEMNFNFRLPQNIPPSFDYDRHIHQFKVNCKIKYYVRIKFDRPGWFAFAKHFRKEITVASTIKPRLSMEPIMLGERSALLQLFSTKSSVVTMKATINNSVIPNGGKIEIQSEIENDSNVVIKSVKTKLIEALTFKTPGHTQKTYEEIPNCDTKTTSIKCGDTQSMPIVIDVPSNRVSLDHSEIVSRDYIVRIIAKLPMPHRNVVLDIPVQIGDKIQRAEICDPPPTYWEVMAEMRKEDNTNDDEALDDIDEKGEKGEKS